MSMIPGILIGVLLLVALAIALRTGGTPGEAGRSVRWVLDGNRETEIISNRRLACLQQAAGPRGILRPHDLVIVWAKQFLDDDILYDVVRDNVHGGVKYLYLLDRVHSGRFENLLRRLYNDTDDARVINTGIDVVFQKPELTMNNYVMLAADSDRERFYSSLIFDYRPFGWVRQSAYRAQVFLKQVRTVVATVGLLQYVKQLSGVPDHLERLLADSTSFLEVEDQRLMDFAGLGRKIDLAEPTSLEEYDYELRRETAVTTLPADSRERVVDIRDRYRNRRLSANQA